jgi:gliding motility-associated-like protein
VVAGQYDPSTMMPGVYVYTVAGNAPCPDAAASVTVTEQVAPVAGTDAAITVCDQGAPLALLPLLTGAQPGGAWTAPGGGAFSGTYDPAADAPGTYIYTVAGTAPCLADQATVTVVETANPFAGADAVLALCGSGAPADLFVLLAGAQPGGTWTGPGGAPFGGIYDPAVHAGGVYTYALGATPPCVSDQATVTVTEVAPADAGADGAVAVCGSSPATGLFPLLAGAQPGGTWTAPGGGAFNGTYDPLLNTPGVYTYTVQGNAPCPNDQSQVTVTENAAPFAGTDALLTICATVAPVDLFVLLGGAQAGGSWTGPLGVFSGVFDPAVDGSGAYVYTVSGAAPCPTDQATVQVTEEPAPFAGADAALTVCAGAPAVPLGGLLVGADPGGSWTDPYGAPFTGPLDPSIAPAGAYTYTVSGVLCPADQAVLQLTIEPGPDAGADAFLAVCADAAPLDLFTQLGGSPDAGGSWWGPGGGAFGGPLDPATAMSGPYLYVVPGTVTCPADSATLLVSVAQPGDAGASATIALCSTDGPLDLFAQLGGTPDAGGAWTDPSGGACYAVIDPATALSGTYTYTVTAAPPCPSGVATVQVSITPVPQVSITLDGPGGCAPVELVLGTDQPVWGSCLWTVGSFTSTQCGGDTLLLDVPGSYPVALTIDAGNGCITTVQSGAPVEVVGQPVAAFTFAPATVTTAAPTVTFQNLSTDASTFLWTFGTAGSSTEAEPTFTFPDALGDAYTVCLTASASPACLDTACATLVVEPSAGLFVPNAFSPDGDGVNDRFVPVVLGMAPEGQELLVVDRWGRVLFATDRPADGWDGTFAGGGPVPTGVLVWRFTGHELHSGARVERMGHVTLVR